MIKMFISYSVKIVIASICVQLQTDLVIAKETACDSDHFHILFGTQVFPIICHPTGTKANSYFNHCYWKLFTE